MGIEIIFVFIIYIILGFVIYKMYKSMKSDFEKTLLYFLIPTFCVPIILFYFDRWNLPSKIGWINNLDSTSWLSSLLSYFGTISSTLISAIFLIFVTKKQIQETSKDNMELNNRSMRLQNQPLLKYDVNNSFKDDLLEEETVFTNFINNDSIHFAIEIENVGLNAVKKVLLSLTSDLLPSNYKCELCNQSSIRVTEIKRKEFIIMGVPTGIHQMNIIVTYQDLLNNWYEQCIEVVFSVEKDNEHVPAKNCVLSFNVCEEKLLLEN